MKKGPIAKPKITLEEAKAVVSTKTAPKVTEQSIEDKIDEVRYLKDGITTICIIEMRNGFKVMGTSTPASVANYDEDVGKRYAYDNAFKQLWVLEGYLLRENLSHAG
jgi:hypothetical protein